MSATPDPADVGQGDVRQYVEQVAPLLGLALPPECREGVTRNLAILLAAGALIRDFPVGEAETAPVFKP
jgi:1-carboxybiuret hydrolase subunit AtzG-like protein